MDIAGYMYRMYLCFFSADGFYQSLPYFSVDDACEWRMKLMWDTLPRSMWLKEALYPEQLPYGYLNYKGKCLLDYGKGCGLHCTRDHCHEREIVGCAKDPP